MDELPGDGMRRYEMADAAKPVPHRAEQACRNLWAAVLAQAVEDYRREPVLRTPPSRMPRSRPDAYARSLRNQYEWQATRVTRWLFEDAPLEAGSFLWICDALQLVPDYVRQRARARRAPMRVFMTVR